MTRFLKTMTFTAVALTLVWADAMLAQRSADAALRAAIESEMTRGASAAIEQYKTVADTYRRSDPAVAAQALLRMAQAYEKLGDPRSREAFEQILRDFPDQKDVVAVANARLVAGSGETALRVDRAVWTGPKVDGFGRVSPDGRFISFTDWIAGDGNLALYDLRSNTDRLLRGNGGQAQWSAVSPDSQYVAYTWVRPSPAPDEVRIVPVSERGVPQPRTLLTFSDVYPAVRDWSPDGKLLAIGAEKSDGTRQIIVASVADGSMRVIKSTGLQAVGRLFFSRDSRYLAFDLPASDDEDVHQHDVFILAIDGSREVRAVSNDADDRVAGWSPDGKYLLFSSTRTGARSLWALAVSDGQPRGQPLLVKTDIGSSVSLGVTNNGALYVHKWVSSRDVKIARLDLDAGTLVGEPMHFSQGLLPEPLTPQWSADGKFLAYPVRGEENGFAIRSVETGAVRRLRNLRKVQDLRWSPDGHSLIAKTEDSKREGIFQIDAQTGRATFIVPTGGGSFPRWSADGKKIYYLKRNILPMRIVERDLPTGIEREVFSHPSPEDIEVSPDGRHLAVRTGIDPASETSSVWVVPVMDGKPREIVRVPAAASVRNTWSQMSWTPDSRSLLTARRSGAARELWLLDTETGSARKLNIDVSGWTLAGGDRNHAGDGGFALSPDGKSITFLMGTFGTEVWALENFLSALK